MLTPLQLREVFHIAFLRQFARKVKPGDYAIKGGVNLRFFYKSLRYSEDMDLDIRGIEVFRLKDIVMEILTSHALSTSLKPFSIERIVPPDIGKAKQTETTQRFKVHLVTSASEDLFTKVEFSRRRFDAEAKMETIDPEILGAYRLHPLIVPHYPAEIAAVQKIGALAHRSHTQARDIFDLFNLLPLIAAAGVLPKSRPPKDTLKKARENIFAISFDEYRETVLGFIKDEDMAAFGTMEAWEEIQLKTGRAIEDMEKL